MTEDEKYVREHVEWVHCCDGSYQGYPRGTILTQSAPGGAKDRKEFDSWSAAAEFTRTRLHQIRDVEEEILWLTEHEVFYGGKQIRDRIATKLNAALADLKRGLRVAE